MIKREKNEWDNMEGNNGTTGRIRPKIGAAASTDARRLRQFELLFQNGNGSLGRNTQVFAGILTIIVKLS